MLSGESDENNRALSQLGGYDGRSVREILLTDQPSAFQQVPVFVTNDCFIILSAGSRDFKRRAVQVKRQSVGRHTVRKRIGVVECHFERRAGAPEFLGALARENVANANTEA